jgi:hypothetical protein
MSHRFLKGRAISPWVAIVALLYFGGSARASFHEWKITEVYSNASGSVQFIEMFDPFSGENFLHLAGARISSGSKFYLFPKDLVGDTLNKHVLIGTPGYEAIPGVPKPDYTFPANNFFNPAGDTVDYDGLDTFTFGAGELPTNGTSSLNKDWGGAVITTAVNSPVNFLGETGQVPEPAAAAWLMAGAMLGSARRSRRRIA